MPALSERGRKSERENEDGDTFTTIVTVLTTAATYTNSLLFLLSSPPSVVYRPSAGRPANGIMLNPRRGKFATRRRDVYLRAVSSSRKICAYNPARVLEATVRSRSRETTTDDSLARANFAEDMHVALSREISRHRIRVRCVCNVARFKCETFFCRDHFAAFFS